MNTKFASPERSTSEEILSYNVSLKKIEFLSDILYSLSFIYCILNKNRQIVFSNETLLNKLGIENPDDILGKRLGEAINCIFSTEEKAGCGTSEHCRYCGAVNAMLQSLQSDNKFTSECRIRTKTNGIENFLDVEVTSKPFEHQNETFLIFSIIDISDRKRKAMIEKIFFHDSTNRSMIHQKDLAEN